MGCCSSYEEGLRRPDDDRLIASIINGFDRVWSQDQHHRMQDEALLLPSHEHELRWVDNDTSLVLNLYAANSYTFEPLIVWDQQIRIECLKIRQNMFAYILNLLRERGPVDSDENRSNIAKALESRLFFSALSWHDYHNEERLRQLAIRLVLGMRGE